MKLEDRIATNAGDIVEMVREYSRTQNELWRRIPHLALEADGRTGHSETYGLAYSYGYWHLDREYGIHVDLENGELVSSSNIWKGALDTHLLPDEKRLANDSKVAALIFNLHKLDARAIMEHLKTVARKPYGSYYNAKKKDVWREETRKIYDVTEIFKRW